MAPWPTLPGRPALLRPLRYDDLRPGLDQRGLQDAVRGRHPSPDRHPRLLAEFSRDAGARNDCAGHHHRRLRGDGGAGLHRQPLDPVRHRARHRHRGRRRDRHRRGRDEIYRAQDVGARRRDPRDGRAVRTDHRHHAGADGGVRSGRVRAGPHRQHVRPVRPRHRGDRPDQRGQRSNLEADPVRSVASHPRPAE